jgi:hypothetical protein
MAAAGKTIVNAGRFVLVGAIMSNPIQDARRELKIVPCFVGTVAHLHITNIDELTTLIPLGRNDFLPCTLTFATIAALFMQSE